VIASSAVVPFLGVFADASGAISAQQARMTIIFFI
jgi:hypothetical protein